MILIKCDRCGEIHHGRSPILVRGYWPKRASGILLPESEKETHFCSHKCIVDWMQWAISQESAKDEMDKLNRHYEESKLPKL